MLSLDLFNSRYEKKLHEGALDNTITRTQAHLMEPLSLRAADIRTQIRSGKLNGAELDKLEKEYEDLVQKRLNIILDRKPTQEAEQSNQAPAKGLLKGKDLVTPQQRVAGATPAKPGIAGVVKDVAGGVKRWLKGEPDQGPTYEEKQLAQSPRAYGVGNFQRLVKANMGGYPTVTLEFNSNRDDHVKLDQRGLDLISDYYDGLENDAQKNHFIYRILPSRDETLRVLKKLGWQLRAQRELPGIPTQGELPLSEKKKSDDLEAGDVKVARELQKLRAQYPAAKSNIEAVARAEIDNAERSQQQLAAIRGANEKQDALLKQLVDLDQEQGREIDNLDQENDNLEKQLAQVQSTNDRLQKTIGQMTGTKTATRSAVKKATASKPGIDLIPGASADEPAPAELKPTVKKSPGSAISSMTRTITGLQGPAPVIDKDQPKDATKPTDKDTEIEKPASMRKLRPVKPANQDEFQLTGTEESLKEGQPQELIHRYLAIDAENDVDAVRAAIQAISKDSNLGANSKSRLLGQIGMIIRRHRLPIGRAYYQFMRQYMEDINETALNPKDPQGDYEAKRRALHDLSLNKDVDQQDVLQRRLDLDREAKAKGLAETVTNVKAGMAEIYRRLAPKIERHRDSFLAGQLYDELENYAELHGAEGEFKRMMSTARGRAHMEYDTNPGGFQNWFWFLPFEDEQLEEGLGDTLKSLWRELKTYVVDFVANAVGLPDDQRREVFVQAGNTFSNEVIKLLANHPARDKLIPMVREIGGYMAKARTLKELNSLMDKADLFLADIDAGKFDPPVAKTLPSFGDRQGITENTDDIKKRMSKLEALALAANRAGDDAKCKMYQQKIQSLKQKLSQSMEEGWSDKYNPTPYSVYIDGREWRAYKSDDHARAVAEKVRANLERQGREQTVTIAPSQAKRVQENISREPRTARERDDMIDKIRRMMTQDRNPANLQIMKKDIEILQTKYRDLKEDSDGGEAVEMAIMRRMLVAHTDLIVEFGLDKVVQAIEEVAYNVGDTDEIGSSDVSGWVRQVQQILGVDA